MIRPLTLLCLIAAGGAGLYLYQVKHSVSLLDKELREIRRETEAALERTQVLRAEWALLNEPERLRAVAQQHLTLEPMVPAQFMRLQDMARRLPAPVVFAGAPSLFAPPETQDEPTAPVAVASAPAPEAERDPAPARVQPTRPPEAAPARTAATVAVAARREPPPRPARTTNVVASARASTMQAAQPVMYTQAPPATPAEAVARIARGAPVDLSQPAVASALGAARPALAPPVPVSSAVAATLGPRGYTSTR